MVNFSVCEWTDEWKWSMLPYEKLQAVSLWVIQNNISPTTTRLQTYYNNKISLLTVNKHSKNSLSNQTKVTSNRHTCVCGWHPTGRRSDRRHRRSHSLLGTHLPRQYVSLRGRLLDHSRTVYHCGVVRVVRPFHTRGVGARRFGEGVRFVGDHVVYRWYGTVQV